MQLRRTTVLALPQIAVLLFSSCGEGAADQGGSVRVSTVALLNELVPDPDEHATIEQGWNLGKAFESTAYFIPYPQMGISYPSDAERQEVSIPYVLIADWDRLLRDLNRQATDSSEAIRSLAHEAPGPALLVAHTGLMRWTTTDALQHEAQVPMLERRGISGRGQPDGYRWAYVVVTTAGKREELLECTLSPGGALTLKAIGDDCAIAATRLSAEKGDTIRFFCVKG